MNPLKRADFASFPPFTDIFSKVVEHIEATDYGEVGLSLKLHEGRVVNVTYTVSEKYKTKGGAE